MAGDFKASIYKKGTDADLDREFASASAYGKVKLGSNFIFCKSDLRWRYLPLAEVQRIYRRVEPVNARMCCSSICVNVERLILILKDGSTAELYIGEDVAVKAKALYQALQEAHPELQYGVVK